MKLRSVILLSALLLSVACGQMGDSMTGLFGQTETPPAAETPEGLDPPADPAGTEVDGALPTGATEETANPAPPPVRSRDIDPANTEKLDSERVICEEKGGRWSRAGASAGFTCVTPTRDANKICTAARQCEGYCLARSGTCSPFTPLFGCHDVVSPNGGMQTICIE